MKYPYMEFFTGDWLRDPAVGMLSPAARGIWVDLMCAMHQDDRSGIICGYVPQLARLARCSADELSGALNEFEVCKTADIKREDNGLVTVINRRMYREAKERAGNRKRQEEYRDREGGNAPVTLPSRDILQASASKSEGSDKACKRDADEAKSGKVALTPRQREVAALCESVLNGQWVNDAGKWVVRIRENAEKVWRVMADVKCAATERRIKTTPAQMAEHNWKVFA